jgi:hypothetical protein
MATVTASYNWVSGETVTPTKLNSTAAPTVVVADNEVTTSKILDANVTTAKIADANVTAAKLASNAVETAKIADDAVTNDKLTLAANAGEIKKALNADNSPPIYACRAWVNFDGTTVTNVGGEDRCTIRESGNVSKVVRNATGRFTVHFTTTMPDTSYCIVGTASVDGTWGVSGTAKYVGSEAQASQLVGSCVIGCFGAPNMSNATIISAAFFR